MVSQNEKNVEFKIRRFNPQNKNQYVSTFTVPVRKGMTLLQALMYIKDNLDGTLAFRHSCRMGVCGSCGVMVNGKPLLACYTQVLQIKDEVLVVEPLQNMPVIKDLVVDVDPFFKKYGKIMNVLAKPKEEFATTTEFFQTPTELKKYWSLSLCIKCCICHSACPATLDERFLGPSTYAANYRFISDSRDEGLNERLNVMADNIWLCTSCNSCSIFCPKEVEVASSIVDERSLTVEAGVIPRNVNEILTNTMKHHNPMGVNQNKRNEWGKNLKVKTFPTTRAADVLYFVGCLGSYDPRAQKVAEALASTFNKLRVDFATLGTEEWCSGDHILRLGEKGLFEELAEHNLSMFQKFDSKRIVTLSPHCFNTFKADSPYVDAQLNVQHYTQFIADALSQRKTEFSTNPHKKITFHDPCFLSKRNDIFEAPRRILKSINGLELIEMKRSKENSFCCGGGGGRVWTEDSLPEDRPSVSRVNEALELNVEVIATACPFCISSLEDSVKVLDAENKIVVKDVVELLIDAI